MEELKAGDLVIRVFESTELIEGDIYVVDFYDVFGAIRVLGYNTWFDASYFKKINIHGEL